MAITIAEFRSATLNWERKRPPITQLWFGTPFQDMLKEEFLSSKVVREQVEFLRNSSGGHFDPLGTLDTPSVEQQFTQVEYDMKLATTSYALPMIDILGNVTPSRLFDLWMEKRLAAERKLREDVITPALFGDALDSGGNLDPNAPLGLRVIGNNDVVSNVPALGKLTLADAAAWAATRDTSAKTISDAFLEESFQVTAFPPRQANIIATTPAIYAKYLAGLTTLKRQQADGSVWYGGMKESGEGGSWIDFHGARFFKDQNAPASHLFILQTLGSINQYDHKQRVPWIYIAKMKKGWFTSDDRVYPLAVDSERRSARVVSYYALITAERRSQQIYTLVS